MGRPLSVFTLSEKEEDTLRSLARRRTMGPGFGVASPHRASATGDPNRWLRGSSE
jgi:hypothetical protein